MKSPKILLLLAVALEIKTGQSQKSAANVGKCLLSYLIYPLFLGENLSLRYSLFTRDNPKLDCDLQPTSDALNKCKFDPELKTKVLVHGWIQHLPPQSLLYTMKDEFLQKDNLNVIVLDWTAYTQDGYKNSVVYSFYVGLRVSAWLRYLQLHAGADPLKFHFITHSLGSELASYAAKTSCSIGHLTFLDPAAPKVRSFPEYLQPSYYDAEFVEAIHTNAALNHTIGYGYERPLADIDYYPDGGKNQSKCYEGAEFLSITGEVGKVDSHSTKRSCEHYAGITYYMESFNKSCEFVGRVCNSYEDYLKKECSNNTLCRMGVYSEKIQDLPPHSKCFLTTSEYPPYCLGQQN